MDQLKNYLAPIVALVLLLAWFFLIRPKLDEAEAEADAAAADDKADKADEADAKSP